LIDCPGNSLQSEICAVTGGSLMQNDTWYILMDGLAINADDEPHFVKASKEVDLFKIPEFEKEAIEKIESAVSDGEPITDIECALAENKDMVDGILDDLTGADNNDRIVLPEDKVHFLQIKGRK